MPIEILNRSFFNTVTSVTTPNFKANAGDLIRCTFTIRENISVDCNGIYFAYNYINNVITASAFNFRGEGFIVGDFVECSHYDNLGVLQEPTYTTTVTAVTASTITIGQMPVNAVSSTDTFVITQNSALPLRTELHLFVNHKQASLLTFDQFSHIDGEATTIQALNLPAITTGVPGSFTQLGNRSGQWEVSNLSINKPDGTPVGNQYVIGFDVIQSGIYQPNLFAVSDDLNLSIGFRMFRITNDLNTATTKFDDYLSNTGWYDEGVNDEPNLSVLDYGITHVYYDAPTTVTFKISAPTSMIGMGVSYIPTDQNYYWNKIISQTKLGMTQPTKGGTMVGLALSGGNNSDTLTPAWTMVVNSVTSVSGGFIVSATFTPTFNGFFDSKPNDRLFRIWAKVDNVNVLVFNDQLTKAPTPDISLTPSILDVVDFTNQDVVASADEILDYVIEDNLAILAVIDMVQDDVLESFDCRVYAYNTVTFEEYTLQSDSFNLTTAPYSGGVYLSQQTINKQYNLASGSVKNVATLTPTSLLGVNYTLLVNYPFLIKWQYWLQAIGAPVTFISNDNQDWTNYTFGDWTVRFEIAKNFGTHRAVYSNLLDFVTYDSDVNVTAHSITLKRANGTVVTNVLDEPMVIEIVQTATGTLSAEFVEVTIESFEGNPRWQLATNYANANPANPLQLVSSVSVGNTRTTIVNLDTSKIAINNGVSISSEIKALAGATKVQERHKEEFKYTKLPIIYDEEDRGIKQCCEPELKLASLSSDDREKNDVTGIAILLGKSGSPLPTTIVAELYKDGVYKQDYLFTSMPNEPGAKQTEILWKQVLIDYGVGCYTVRIVGTISGIAYDYLYQTYKLYPYNSMTSKNQFRLRCYLDKYSSSQNINYQSSNFVDDFRYKGRFGQMQPKTKIDNLVYTDRTTRTIINENIPEYVLETYKMKPIPVNRLVEMLLLSTTIEASDYNAYSPDYVSNLPVILPVDGQGAVLEYLGATRDRIVSVTLQKKVLNERMYKK